VSQRQAFIVRVEADGQHVTVEDVRAARAAQVEKLACVGVQIERWLALAEREKEPWPEEPQSQR
jgi:hypothetical protein